MSACGLKEGVVKLGKSGGLKALSADRMRPWR